MGPPEDQDQASRWPRDGSRWYFPPPNESEESNTQEAFPSPLSTQSGPSRPPRPRPAYRGTPTSTAQAPTSDTLPSFSQGFPPITPSGPSTPSTTYPHPHPYPTPHAYATPHAFPPHPSASSGSFLPPPRLPAPVRPVSPSPPVSQPSAGGYPPFLQSEPSSCEGSPRAPAEPCHPPRERLDPGGAETPKPDKGKKRALDSAGGPATKKPKSAAPKPKPAAPPRMSVKARGKQPARPAAALSQSHTGRQPGASNYTDVDMDALLDLVEEELPIGQNAWQRITDSFNSWAQENGRPPRTQKPLKTKYDALVRTPKPTGSASVPANVERAWDIEEQINEKIHLGVLDDGDIADTKDVIDVDEDATNSDLEFVDPVPALKSAKERGLLSALAPKVRPTSTPVVKAAYRDPAASSTARAASSSRRAQAQDFMSAVTASLDPSNREARDDTRFARKLAQDELLRLSNDNRDLRARNDTLTDRLHQQGLQIQQQMTEVTRLQARLDMFEMMQSMTGRHRPRTGDWDVEDSPRPRRQRTYAREYSPLPSFASAPRSPSPPRSFTPVQHYRGPTGSLPTSSSARQQATSTPRSRGAPVSPAASTSTPAASGSGLEALAAAASTSTHAAQRELDAPNSASLTFTFTSPSRRLDPINGPYQRFSSDRAPR